MSLKLTDFPNYVSEGQEKLIRQGCFFVRGSGNIDIGKSERLSILSRIVEKLEAGMDSCLIYTEPGDTETREALKATPRISNRHNQLIFSGSISELAGLCDTYSDDNCDGIRISILLKLKRDNVNWRTVCSSLYDPGFLENPKSVVSPSAYNYAKKAASDEFVVLIIYATAYFFPSFLVFGQTTKYDLFSDYAVTHCHISERFRNLYSHFLNT